MERRSFILTSLAGAATAALAPAQVFAAKATAIFNPKKLTYSSPESLAALDKIKESITQCMEKGQACVDHCKKELAAGNTEMEKCYATVQAMMTLCDATKKLAELKSVQVRNILGVCIGAVDDCRKACMEHQAHFAMGMHLECKACAEACSNCGDTCKSASAVLKKEI